MKMRDWVWIYLSAGEPFTRSAALLFYGAIGGLFVAAALLALLTWRVLFSRGDCRAYLRWLVGD